MTTQTHENDTQKSAVDLQKYGSPQKLSQIGNSRLFREIFQHSNFRNKFIIVFYSCVRVVDVRVLNTRG
ncbi:hypothetical protein BUQ74_08250 [Leptospira weilii serovar Heyan]|nr:hypothetical protein BUQ74_08250 [Leptospira weilii serovar Heyan]